ncbi:MAG: FtsW/RodA/SpoVE family cell cycle protein [Phycisphaerae bacterium]
MKSRRWKFSEAAPLPSRFGSASWAVLAAVAMLYVVGLLCIYATEVSSAAAPGKTIKHLVNLAIGLGAFMLILRVGHQRIGRFAVLIVALGLLGLVPLLVARHVPLGDVIPRRRGAFRWIQLPFYSYQPSEFMKIAFIVGLAAYLRYRRNYRTFLGLMIPMAASLVPLALILMEPDLGTALLIMPVLFVMLFAAGAKTKHFVAVGACGLCVMPVLWTRLQPYQRSRFLGVLLQSEGLRARVIEEPHKYRFLGSERQSREWEHGSGMQLVRSKAALGSGGLTGHGWARGAFVEFSFLPDKHNDFIFAMVGHQWGLVGCLLVVTCYVIMVLAGIEIAAATPEPFARLLAVGVVALLSTQVAINIGMTIGLVPITGMTLPFVSYGGSSLLANFIGIGLLISVSRSRPFLLADKPFEFGASAGRDAALRPAPSYRAGP